MLLSWCGWYIHGWMQFYENVGIIWYEAFVAMAERNGCHGSEIEMVPRRRKWKWCHGNIPVPVTRWDTGAKEQVCGCAEYARDGGVIPVTGFPRVDGMTNKEERASLKSDTMQTRASHTRTCIRSRTSSRGYTFEACIIGTDPVCWGKLMFSQQ